MKIGLLRHGRTAWNDAGRLQGRTDIPITDAERSRLSGLALPDEWKTADLLASPLHRAAETARIVSGTEPATDTRLLEMNLGEWEGCRSADLLDDPSSGFRHVEDWGWAYHPPDGETLTEMRDRVQAVLDGLSRDTVIVSHIIVMRIVLAIAHDWHFDSPAPFTIKRNRIYGVERQQDGTLIPMGEPIRLVAR